MVSTVCSVLLVYCNTAPHVTAGAFLVSADVCRVIAHSCYVTAGICFVTACPCCAGVVVELIMSCQPFVQICMTSVAM